jgi:hypothetical protein
MPSLSPSSCASRRLSRSGECLAKAALEEGGVREIVERDSDPALVAELALKGQALAAELARPRVVALVERQVALVADTESKRPPVADPAGSCARLLVQRPARSYSSSAAATRPRYAIDRAVPASSFRSLHSERLSCAQAVALVRSRWR